MDIMNSKNELIEIPLFVYVYDDKGITSFGIKITAELEQVASLIVQVALVPQVIVRDENDDIFLDIRNGLVYKCADLTFMQALLQVLIPMKMGLTPMPALKLGWDRWGDLSQERHLEFLKKRFGIELKAGRTYIDAAGEKNPPNHD